MTVQRAYRADAIAPCTPFDPHHAGFSFWRRPNRAADAD
ncbi:hypothetical protein BURMUCF1_B0228 [Burkholderia multivorans ATCC BAA-247]|nr:hypothetical protein BURMUCGD1_6166 [Burkholderia multivorans CGD1]EJO58163.1 hypothetical protein BURMUCF1_B0228 [Burkholderia multivorans ATCC BAA-247]